MYQLMQYIIIQSYTTQCMHEVGTIAGLANHYYVWPPDFYC